MFERCGDRCKGCLLLRNVDLDFYDKDEVADLTAKEKKAKKALKAAIESELEACASRRASGGCRLRRIH